MATITKRKSKYEYWKNKNGKWFFHLRARNGEIILQSEAYATKQKVLEGINANIRNMIDAITVEI
jgi:uncharacterized protein YegP (UPF0339 family)